MAGLVIRSLLSSNPGSSKTQGTAVVVFSQATAISGGQAIDGSAGGTEASSNLV
jgi:hypothetical protein